MTETQRACAFCGGSMSARPQRAKYCSTRCKSRASKPSRAHALTLRVRALGARIVEEVDPDVVYQRDRGICYLCDKPVERDHPWRRMRPSVDHVIPIARGGEHSYANVRLAHLGCNSTKGDSILDVVGFELRRAAEPGEGQRASERHADAPDLPKWYLDMSEPEIGPQGRSGRRRPNGRAA